MLEAKVAVKDDEIDRQQRELQTLRVRNWLLRYCMYEKDSPGFRRREKGWRQKWRLDQDRN